MNKIIIGSIIIAIILVVITYISYSSTPRGTQTLSTVSPAAKAAATAAVQAEQAAAAAALVPNDKFLAYEQKLLKDNNFPTIPIDYSRKCSTFTEVWSTELVTKKTPEKYARFLTPTYDTKKYVRLGDAIATDKLDAFVYLIPRTFTYIYSTPTDAELVWSDKGSGATKDCFVWKLIPEKGYTALGFIVSSTKDKPALGNYACIIDRLLTDTKLTPVWNDKGTGAETDCFIYKFNDSLAGNNAIAFKNGQTVFSGFKRYI